jgi:hypothetical protein
VFLAPSKTPKLPNIALNIDFMHNFLPRSVPNYFPNELMRTVHRITHEIVCVDGPILISHNLIKFPFQDNVLSDYDEEEEDFTGKTLSWIGHQSDATRTNMTFTNSKVLHPDDQGRDSPMFKNYS